MTSKLYKVNPFFIDVNKNKIGIIGYRDKTTNEVFLSYEYEVMLLEATDKHALIFHPDGIVWVELSDISGPFDGDQLLVNLATLAMEKK